MRTLFAFARNCGYLRDSTGFLRANCGLARRRKSTNFTYRRVVSTTSAAQAQFWSKQRIRANPGNTCELGAIDEAKRVAKSMATKCQVQVIAGTCAGCHVCHKFPA